MTTAVQGRAPEPQHARDFSDWHERSIAHLISRNGSQVQIEPHISGQTPDLLVTPPNAEQFIVECVARLQDPSHAAELALNGRHTCAGNTCALHQNIFSRLQCKASKYRHITRDTPYVISLYDASCHNGIDTALDLAMSPYAPTLTLSPDGKIDGRLYNTLWPAPAIPAALFELYPHVSGFLYSTWPWRHYYLPNPHAERPLPPGAFPFAQVPELPPRYHRPDWRPRAASIFDDSPTPPIKWLPQLQRLAAFQRSNANLPPAIEAYNQPDRSSDNIPEFHVRFQFAQP